MKRTLSNGASIFAKFVQEGLLRQATLQGITESIQVKKIISVRMRAVDRGLVDMITVISIIELMQTRRKETGRGGRLAVDVSELSQKHLNIQITYK